MNQRQNTFTKYFAVIAAGFIIAGFVIDMNHSPNDLPHLDGKQVEVQAASSGKPMFIDVGASWCQPCRKMEATVFSVDSVKKFLTAHFVVNQIDAGDKAQSEFVENDLGVDALPTIIVMRSDGIEWKRQTGYIDANRLIAWLKDSTYAFVLYCQSVEPALRSAKEKQLPCMIICSKKQKGLSSMYTLFQAPVMQAFIKSEVVATILRGYGNGSDEFLKGMKCENGTLQLADQSILVVQADGKRYRQIVVKDETYLNPNKLLDSLKVIIKQQNGS